MKKTLLSSILVVVFSLNSHAIIGGKKVEANDPIAKSTVAIIADSQVPGEKQSVCTGTLITPQTVLTAAHCIDQKPKTVAVVFDRNFLNMADANTQFILHASIHPDWWLRDKSKPADIAVLRLEKPAPDGYVPAQYLTQPPLKPGAKTVVAGFGISDLSNEHSIGDLRKTENTLAGFLSEKEVALDSKKSGACFGDSGGPAYLVIDKIPYLWGVASVVSSPQCNRMSLYTDARLFIVWINRAIDQLAKDANTKETSSIDSQVAQ